MMTYEDAYKVALGEKGWGLTVEQRANIKIAPESDVRSIALADMGEVSTYCRMMLAWL